MSDLKYKNTILDLSLLLNSAQKPIQILDAIKWNDEISDFIIKNNFKEMPKIDYSNRSLKYDPEKKLQEFKELRLKITKPDVEETSFTLEASIIKGPNANIKVRKKILGRGYNLDIAKNE